MTPSSFEMSKIIGALLLAGFVAIASGAGSSLLYNTDSDHITEKRGFTIAVTLDDALDNTSNIVGISSAVAAEPKKPVEIAEFMAKADIEKGKKLIKKCVACHTFDKGGKDGVGPNQWAVFGSNFGHSKSYAYSDAIKELSHKKWGEQELSEFLTKPRKYIPGNKMAFAGIKKPQDRANLIAYLKTLR